MALQGNFRRKLGTQDKAPNLKHAVKHGDVVYLPGQPVPERFSKRKIETLRERGYTDR